MDHFGIGAAMQAMLLNYSQAARGTGRTTSLVESVKTGDRIVFTNPREAARVKRLCAERGVTVDCVAIDPTNPRKLFESGPSKGRTIFDHTWVEMHYARFIEAAQKDIDLIERETSGYGEAHRETRRRAEEIRRWNP